MVGSAMKTVGSTGFCLDSRPAQSTWFDDQFIARWMITYRPQLESAGLRDGFGRVCGTRRNGIRSVSRGR